MMDVMSARHSEEQLEIVINSIQQVIEEKLKEYEHLPEDQHTWNHVITELCRLENDILSCDFGGYHSDYRIPLIARLDTLRLMIGVIPPYRPDYIFTQSGYEYFQRQYKNGVNRQMIPSDHLQRIINEQNLKKALQNQRRVVPLFHDINQKPFVQEMCVICLLSFTCADDVSGTYLSCGHRFHNSCIMNWIQRKPLCPVCKKNPYIL
jgi:hypothetical protein